MSGLRLVKHRDSLPYTPEQVEVILDVVKNRVTPDMGASCRHAGVLEAALYWSSAAATGRVSMERAVRMIVWTVIYGASEIVKEYYHEAKAGENERIKKATMSKAQREELAKARREVARLRKRCNERKHDLLAALGLKPISWPAIIKRLRALREERDEVRRVLGYSIGTSSRHVINRIRQLNGDSAMAAMIQRLVDEKDLGEIIKIVDEIKKKYA